MHVGSNVDEGPLPKVRITRYIVLIEVFLFKKIKLFSKTIDNEDIKKVKKGKILSWLDKKLNTRIEDDIKDITQFLIKERKRVFTIKTWRCIKNLNMKVSELAVDMQVGTENAATTAYVTATIASVIALLLTLKVEKENAKNFRHKITPVYMNQNFIKIQFNCTVKIKMIHIMNIVYALWKQSNYHNKVRGIMIFHKKWNEIV